MENAIEELTKILQTLQRSRTDESTNSVSGITLHTYDELNETFDSYLQRLQNYFEIKKLTDDTADGNKKCVQILISCLSPKIYHTLTSLTAPELPKDKTYKELITALRKHLSPTPNEISEQHKFASRLQHEGESIAKYAAELKKLTTNCKFTCEECKKPTINLHLRSQFIRGIRDNEIRQRLFQESSSIVFDKVVDIALSVEASKQFNSQLEHSTAVNSLSHIHKPKMVNKEQFKCFKCGSNTHKANDCKEINLKCKFCKKSGHLASVCFKKPKMFDHNILYESVSESEEEFLIHSLQSKDKYKKILLDTEVNGRHCQMELDTGAAVSTISLYNCKKLLPGIKIYPTSVKLRTYTGEIIKPIGKTDVNVKWQEKSFVGTIYVLDGNVDSIFGREWLNISDFKLNIYNVESCKLQDSKNEYLKKLNNLVDEFQDLFSKKIGKIPKFQCNLKFKNSDCKSKFMKPRPVPYALKEKIENELDRLEKLNIITKITHCSWGTPVVPVVKKNGDLRLCADYKTTINPVLQDDKYPIPRVEEIFAKMAGGKYFCTLDISEAYLHLEMDDQSALYQAISTHKGVYKVNRLMFGVKVAPNNWQRFMDQMLLDLEGVGCFFDDIVIQGKTYDELLQRLRVVFERLRENDLHLNKSKCQLLQDSVMYLGHIIDHEGLHPIPDKIKAIVDCKPPSDITSLRVFLGLVNYYQKFLPNLSSILKPLHILLQKNVRFHWSKSCQESFDDVKKKITSTQILTPFDIKLPLILATDASPNGLGAVISHRMLDGTEKPIAFASRSLTKAERNYSQIDREATAILWGLRKFFQYCYGRKFTLLTDNKPLVSIFNPSNGIPATAAMRLHHYASFLSGFDYIVEYRKTTEHANADFLSRFPLENPKDVYDEDIDSVFQQNQIDTLPVSQDEIRKETTRDLECSELFNAIQSGRDLQNLKVTDFSLQNGCIFKGIRVVIPKTLQHKILNELHSSHIGIVRMKNLARSYVWWKGIDKDIEDISKSCENCNRIRNDPAKVNEHFWEYPKYPWQRLHIDYAGPFMESYFLIVVDAHTKWVEVFPTKSISSNVTIKCLRELFARFGLPITLVSDNGSQFKSEEFELFLKKNGISHKVCAPYHPSTNGQAERYVQTIKHGLRAMIYEEGDVDVKLCRLLMQYRKVPNSTTGVSPAELMFKREFRTRLDLVKRDLYQEMNKSNSYKTVREFQIGQNVIIRIYNNKQIKWSKGVITARTGKLHYEISVEGKIHSRHIDQIRRDINEKITKKKYNILDTDDRNSHYEQNDEALNISFDNDQEITSNSTIVNNVPDGVDNAEGSDFTNITKSCTGDKPEEDTHLRRSSRSRKPPERLML